MTDDPRDEGAADPARTRPLLAVRALRIAAGFSLVVHATIIAATAADKLGHGAVAASVAAALGQGALWTHAASLRGQAPWEAVALGGLMVWLCGATLHYLKDRMPIAAQMYLAVAILTVADWLFVSANPMTAQALTAGERAMAGALCIGQLLIAGAVTLAVRAPGGISGIGGRAKRD